jgi:hypothetical protein
MKKGMVAQHYILIIRTTNESMRIFECSRTGLPDFSEYNIPKQEKMYQINIKYICQMATQYTK